MPEMYIDGSDSTVSHGKKLSMIESVHTTHREELVKTRNDKGDDKAKKPHSERVDGHIWIISIGDCSSHFSIR